MYQRVAHCAIGWKFALRKPMSQAHKSVRCYGQGGPQAPGIIEANRWDPEQYNKNAKFVHELAGPVLDLLSPEPGNIILDLGCGEGSVAKKLKDFGCKVIGVDASQAMVDATLAEGIEAYRMDGHDLTFAHKFDAVFSNAALHWMSKDPVRVIQGVRRALKPGGQFVGEFGGHGNVAAVVTAISAVLHNRGVDINTAFPWYFPSPEEYKGLLEQEGFNVESIELIPRPTLVSTGVVGWLETFATGIIQDLPESTHGQVLNEIQTLLKPSLQRWDGAWTVDYVRLRFKATLSE